MRRTTSYVLLTLLLVSLTIAFFYVDRVPHGLAGTYYGPDKRFIVHERIDRNLSFPGGMELFSVYANQWDLSQLPFPERFAGVLVEWSGNLVIPGTDELSRAAVPGLLQRIYGGPAFTGSPASEQTVSSIPPPTDALAGISRPVSIEWMGYLAVPADGVYEFELTSDDGSWLFVDDEVLINNGERHSNQGRRGRKMLSSGLHPFTLRYNDYGGASRLGLAWSRDQSPFEPLPPQVFFHDQAAASGRRLAVRTTADFVLRLGDMVVDSARSPSLHYLTPALQPGVYPLRLKLRSRKAIADFDLRWREPDGTYAPVRYNAFFPNSVPGEATKKVNSARAALLAVLLLLIALSARCLSDYGRWLAENRTGIAVAAIAAAAFILRFHQYDEFPFFLETIDEFKAGWIGWNLLHAGRPTGYSGQIEASDLSFQWWFSNFVRIAPFKFHPPPLFPLLTALFSTAAGAGQMYQVTLAQIRLPAVLCSTAAALLVFALARRSHGDRAGIFAALIFACLPTIVFSGRLAKEENLLSLLSLLSLFAMQSYCKNNRTAPLLLAAISAGLCLLTKEVGAYVGAALLMVLLRSRGTRPLTIFVPAYLAVCLLYPLYGAAYNWGEFWRAFRVDSMATGTMIGSAQELFRSGAVVQADFGANWMLWLWASFFMVHRRSDPLIRFTILSYLLVSAVLLMSKVFYGWYLIPLYPLLAISAGQLLSDSLFRPRPVPAFIFILLAVCTSAALALPAGTFLTPHPMRIGLLVLTAPVLFDGIRKTKVSRALAQAAMAAAITLFAAANTSIVLNFSGVVANQRYPLPPGAPWN